MDYQEAIEYFEKELRYKKMVLSPLLECKESVNEQYIKTAISAMQELQEYKQLGTLAEVREAVEKQKAQEPQLMYGMYGRVYLCKKCGNEFELSSQYCPFCGQKQDWE